MKKFLWIIIAVLVLVVILKVLSPKNVKKEQLGSLKVVKVAKVGKGDIDERVYYQGMILGKYQASLYPNIAAKLEKFLVNIGDYVKKGQKLAKLENIAFISAYNSAEAALKSAKIAYESAKSDFERQTKLYEEKAISEKTYQLVKTQFEQAKAGLAAAQAQYNTAKKQLEDSYLTSPINGVVVAYNADVGNMVNPQVPIITIADTNLWKVKVDVAPIHLTKIKQGIDAIIITQAGDTLKGKVSKVDIGVDPQFGKGVAEIMVNSSIDSRIIAGTWCDVYFITKIKKDVIVIPSYALIEATKLSIGENVTGYKSYYKIAVVKNSKVQIKPVEVGIQNKDFVEVKSGLDIGEDLVIEGQRRVQNGEAVKVVR